jgi:hypothetical protein
VTYKLGICITKSPYQTVGTICYRCRSCFWELLFRAIPLSCRGFGGFYGHCKRTVVSIWNSPTNKCASGWCGWEIAFGSTWDAREGIAFGSTWDALGLWAATELPRVFAEAKNSSSSYVQQVQLPCARSKSVLDHKRSSSTTTWRVGRGGSCCYVWVCTRNFTLYTNSLRSTPLFIPDSPEWKQRRHSEITAIVSFPVLFLSMYCLLLTIRVFCFLKNLHLIWL